MSAAYDWGRSVGRVRRANNSPVGDAAGSGLRGAARAAFLAGLAAGWAE